MKEYPSIQNSSKAPHEPCFAFVKYDGSNLRFEYSKKQGWHKFGTRHTLFDKSHETFGPAVDLFLNKYGDELPKVFKTEKLFRGVDRVIVFCEFFGANSFAGDHQPDDPKDVVLFDVNPITKGMLAPKQFLDCFGHLRIAECVWQGNLGAQLIQKVKDSDYSFIDFQSKYEIKQELPEGVICKGGSGHKLWLCKIKTNAYFARLQDRCPATWQLLWE